MKIKQDIIVIGGGINGVSIAYNLAKNGASVTLLEKSYIAGGPSGLSSAIVRQHYSNPVTARMALDSLRVWQNFVEIFNSESVFTQTGFLLGATPEELEALQANIALQQSVGINTQYVSIDELRELEPHINPGGLGGAAFEPEAGFCDPNAAANGIAHAAKKLGAEILPGVQVTGLNLQENRIRSVETDQGKLDAWAVVIAAGPWSSQLLRHIGIEIPLITARVNVVIYKRPTDFERHHIWGDFITKVYLRPETGGMMLVGSISPDEETGDQITDPDHFNDKVEVDVIASFADRIALRYPAMERSHIASSYASLYDISPDWHSIMDAVPGVEGLFICAGSSGHGFKLAPAVGEMMSKLVLEGKNLDDDINLFAWDRFETGNLVRGQYDYSILG